MTLIFTKIIFTDSAYLVSTNIRIMHTFLSKALINLTIIKNFDILVLNNKLNDLVKETFGSHYFIEIDVDEKQDDDYNVAYKQIVVSTTLINISKSYH